MNIEDIIKSIRKELHITQEQFARDLDISYTTFNRWENARNSPSRLARKEIARYCAEKNVSEALVAALERA
jgi:DNA-binding transcriptional regulator YiaG